MLAVQEDGGQKNELKQIPRFKISGTPLEYYCCGSTSLTTIWVSVSGEHGPFHFLTVNGERVYT